MKATHYIDNASEIIAERQRSDRETRHMATWHPDSVHTKELARCKHSPIGVHVWQPRKRRSCIFQCQHCGGFRAFNIRLGVIPSPFVAKEFMHVFKASELNKLKSLVKSVKKKEERQPMNRFSRKVRLPAN